MGSGVSVGSTVSIDAGFCVWIDEACSVEVGLSVFVCVNEEITDWVSSNAS